MPDFYWDKKTQRYRYADTKRFVSTEAVQNLTKKAIAQVREDVSAIGNLLVDGKITVATWESETAKALKTLRVQAYILGKGGQAQMGQADYGRLGQQMRFQYERLRGFSQDLIDGKLSVEQFRQRLDLYAKSCRGAYEVAREEGHKDNGYQWERRYRFAAESCGDCIGYANQGWQPIGTLPAPMEDCQCAANCKCLKRYSKDKPQDSLTGKKWGFVGHSLKARLVG